MKYKDHPLVEARAHDLYDSLYYPVPGEKPKWVPGGNSLVQADCFRDAITQLEAEGVHLFDTYWPFQEHFEYRRILGRLLNPSVLAFEISSSTEPAHMDIRAEYVGTLSFDGCFNWSTSAHYNVHMCDLSEFGEVQRAFDVVRGMAAAHLEGWIA